MSTQYRLYKGNSSGGPVDYSTVVATTSSLSQAMAALAPSTSTRFAVRAYDTVSLLDDGNTDAQVLVTVSAAGADASNAPYAPQALTASPAPGGTAVVEWSYPYLDRTKAPTGFHAYTGTGGVVSYAAPAATVTAPDRSGAWRATLTGLTGGTTYSVGVRAFNASGEELNTTAVTVTAVTATPPAVQGLTATPDY